ncbi:potassium efflux system KefA protein [Klebsiella pneumoniae subsp. pneumoniae]|nr:potassium efflux system KefA protein [Klebsiella pneumoniae subsp. pneumoniae]
METEVSEVDLDAISTQSLRLVRSLLMLIALLSVHRAVVGNSLGVWLP